ncbi:UPF0721 transmembrane protein [Amylibacter marinus]|uniref:Probable membrane transporter protein n=1 Tax=Amylibacter marinus TaxID=1475483 RepID=A0ABQ5VSI2_9RHOB|nr:sulfite exporter TauE/SafE family protein [Amylibacter marinus]GLQ34388.1 UPF0721 transmembrane protein [Amylibacter marinus]
MMDLPLSFFAVAAIMVFLTGVSKSGLAAGFGALSVPMLSLFIHPAMAAGILLPLLVGIDSTNLWNYRHHAQRRILIMLIPGAMVGIALGALTFGKIDPSWVRLLVGCIALWFAGAYYLSPILPKIGGIIPLKYGVLFAIVSGFTSHLAHAGAPPVRAFLLNQRLQKSEYVGTMGFLFAWINLMKLPPYLYFGQITWQTGYVSMLLAPMIPLGVFIGLKVHKSLPQELFIKIAYFLLTFAGLKLIYDGITQVM